LGRKLFQFFFFFVWAGTLWGLVTSPDFGAGKTTALCAKGQGLRPGKLKFSQGKNPLIFSSFELPNLETISCFTAREIKKEFYVTKVNIPCSKFKQTLS
jgi:hypothetical protein